MLTLDIDVATLTDGDRSVHLTPAQANLLRAMADGCSTYAELWSRMWPDPDQEPNSDSILKVQVSKLRKRLNDNGFQPLIGTLWGRGYKLGAKVLVISSAPAATIPPELVPNLRAILYASCAPSASRLLEIIGG
jgi:DNA-binding winged helix-turn-helix (wHTH) protein